MKKFYGIVGVAVLALATLSACQTLFGRGRGPVVSFAFLPAYNPGISRPIQGRINESSNPKIIEVVVPPGTDVSHLVATFSFNTEANIDVVSSGQDVAQKNSQTPNNFQTAVLYSIRTPKDKKPWLYRVMVRQADQNASLSRIRVVDGTPLDPAFNPGTMGYASTVPYGSTRVTIEAAAQSPHLWKMTVGGHEVAGPRASVALPFIGTDHLSVPITAIAEDQATTAHYTVDITRGEPDRNSSLAELSIRGAAVSPIFSPSQRSYSVQLPYSAQTLDLRAIPESKYAAVSLTIPTQQGTLAPLPARGNPRAEAGARVSFSEAQRMDVVVVVTAQDGSTTDYSITVTRAAPERNNLLDQLQVPDSSVSPQFDPRERQYTVEVPFNSTRFNVVAIPQSAVASVTLTGARYAGNPATPDGAAVSFSGVDNALVRLRVTAQDGSVREYTLHIRRGRPDSNSHLATLLVTPGTLSPGFSSRIVTYNAVIPGNVPSATVTVQTSSPYATVATSETGIVHSGNAANGKRFTVPVAPGKTHAIDLVVTAQDGSQRLYRVNITREAAPVQPSPKEHNSRLSGIVVAGAGLAPTFSPNRFAYEVKVPTSRNRVSVFPIAESPRARVTIDGKPVGSEARTVQLQPGHPKLLVIEVVAEDGSRSRYTVTLTRDLPRPVQPPAEQQHGSEPQQSDNGSGRASLTGQPEEGHQGAQQPAESRQTLRANLTVRSDGIRLEPRLWKEMRDVGDELGPQAIVTVRAVDSNEVLAQGTAAIQVRQPGNSPPEISIDWQSPSFDTHSGTRVSIEVSVRTQRGGYVRFTEVLPVKEHMSVSVSGWTYEKSGR